MQNQTNNTPRAIAKLGLAIATAHGDTIFPTFSSEEDRQKRIEEVLHNTHIRRVERCMVRKTAFRTPNQAEVDTGTKAFDRQCQSIAFSGNLIANTFYGNFVRARSTTQCNGFEFGLGELQKRDLELFEKNRALHSRAAQEFIKKSPFCEENDVILTMVFHTRRESNRNVFVVHGAIIVNRKHQLIKRFDRFNLGLTHSARSLEIMNTVVPLMTDQAVFDRELVFSKD